MNYSECASCDINASGRLLSANGRFCRMFGFTDQEIPWHYIKDLYRYAEDWETFKKYDPKEQEKLCFFVRLRNRAGRSYKCSLERSSFFKDGKWTFHLDIEKLDSEGTSEAVKDFKNITESVRVLQE